MMMIYIPTIARADKQRTATILREAGLDFTLVTSDTDPHSYEGWPHVVIEEYGIRATRQWIMDNAEDKFVMMDDDLRFFMRYEEKKFKPAEPGDVAVMVKALDMLLEEFAHGGVAPKFMSHELPRNFTLNTKYYHILAYNKNLFPDPAPQYRVEIGEDQDMNLQLLLAGKPNFLLTEWCQEDKSHAEGGCNAWRNLELETAEAKRLCELFPGLVTHIKGPDVRVNWKKAAEKGGLSSPG